MTTDHQMAMMYAAQKQDIAVIRGIDEPDLANRLERCATPGANGAAPMGGRTLADLLHVSGADDR
jgi:hypothetical protein